MAFLAGLLVAMGVPHQELWIRRNLSKLGAKVAIGVGGLFDFYSGRIPRAPMWVREIGMEWFYRFSQEPSRLWKRYLIGNNVFLFHVLQSRLAEMSQSRRLLPLGQPSDDSPRLFPAKEWQ